MALQACHECGHQVSSEASSCPSCGAKVRPPIKAPAAPAATLIPDLRQKISGWQAFGLVATGLVIVTMVATCADSTRHQEWAAARNAEAGVGAQAPAPAPTHHWVVQDGYQYGYRIPTSEADRYNGIGAHQLMMVRLVGSGDKGFTFGYQDVGGWYTMNCDLACAQVRILMPSGYKYMEVTPGTVIADIVEDARAGFMKPTPY